MYTIKCCFRGRCMELLFPVLCSVLKLLLTYHQCNMLCLPSQYCLHDACAHGLVAGAVTTQFCLHGHAIMHRRPCSSDIVACFSFVPTIYKFNSSRPGLAVLTDPTLHSLQVAWPPPTELWRSWTTSQARMLQRWPRSKHMAPSSWLMATWLSGPSLMPFPSAQVS